MILDKDYIRPISKYPFDTIATLILKDAIKFPAKLLNSVRLQVSKADLYYISDIYNLLRSVRIVIRDRSGYLTIHADIYALSVYSYILDLKLLLRGSIYYDKSLYSNLSNIMYQLGTSQIVNIDSSRLLLDSSVVNIVRLDKPCIITINGVSHNEDVVVYCTNNFQCVSSLSLPVIQFNLFGDLNLNMSLLLSSPIATLLVNSDTYDCKDKILLLKPSALSDIRVVTSNLKIQIKSVIDAKNS